MVLVTSSPVEENRRRQRNVGFLHFYYNRSCQYPRWLLSPSRKSLSLPLSTSSRCRGDNSECNSPLTHICFDRLETRKVSQIGVELSRTRSGFSAEEVPEIRSEGFAYAFVCGHLSSVRYCDTREISVRRAVQLLLPQFSGHVRRLRRHSL